MDQEDFIKELNSITKLMDSTVDLLKFAIGKQCESNTEKEHKNLMFIIELCSKDLLLLQKQFNEKVKNQQNKEHEENK